MNDGSVVGVGGDTGEGVSGNRGAGGTEQKKCRSLRQRLVTPRR